MQDNKNWLTRLFTGSTEVRDVNGPNPGVIPPVRSDIDSVSVDLALSISAVYRSVSVITSSVSQMPLGVYRNNVEIDTPSIIKNPNPYESQRAFIKKTVWSLVTHGNAFWRVYGSPVASLEVLDPDAVTVVIENGKVKYWIGSKELDAKHIKHLRLEPRPGQAKGIGPIQRGQSELIGALRLRNFQDNWFGVAGVPTGVLTTDQTLNAAQQEAYAIAWNEFVKNNGTAVLGNGMRYDTLHIKPAEAQFLEVMQAKTTAIARLFGVPATLLASGNEGTSNVYMNNQELFMTFLQTTLTDYMNAIEDAFTELLPRGQTVEFKEDAFLRMNTVLETQVWSDQIAAGIITPNEVRAKKGLPPLATPKPVENTEKDEPND